MEVYIPIYSFTSLRPLDGTLVRIALLLPCYVLFEVKTCLETFQYMTARPGASHKKMSTELGRIDSTAATLGLAEDNSVDMMTAIDRTHIYMQTLIRADV